MVNSFHLITAFFNARIQLSNATYIINQSGIVTLIVSISDVNAASVSLSGSVLWSPVACITEVVSWIEDNSGGGCLKYSVQRV